MYVCVHVLQKKIWSYNSLINSQYALIILYALWPETPAKIQLRCFLTAGDCYSTKT